MAASPPSTVFCCARGAGHPRQGSVLSLRTPPRLEIEPGDTIEVLYESGDNDVLSVHELTVVGTVSSSNYPYTISFGSTTLGSGMLDQYLYVTQDTFVEGTPTRRSTSVLARRTMR